MRNCSGPEVILAAFQFKPQAEPNTKTHDLKPNNVLGKYDSLHYIPIEDHQR